jgi:hypothetical protein
MEWAAAFVALLTLAVWKFVRRQYHGRGGPLADVPDAPPTAEAIEAPGLTLPYSSLDPFAPPKPSRESDGLGPPPKSS